MEYNTTREHLINREYGRHIQKTVNLIMQIKDRDERTRSAYAVIELMAAINPLIKQEEDYDRKLWDHLYLISDFKLDVDAPYPMIDKQTYVQKPEPMSYPHHNPKYNHLGKNIELLIQKTLSEEDEEIKQALSNVIAYYMKLTYSTWHGELVHDDNIRAELAELTDGELTFDTKLHIKHKAKSLREGGGSQMGGRIRRNGGQHNKNGRNNNRNNRRNNGRRK